MTNLERGPRIIDLARPAHGIAVAVRPSIAVEFLMSLLAAGMPEASETFDARPEGFDDDRSRLSTDALNALDRLGGPGGRPSSNLIGPARRDPVPPDVPSFLEELARTPAEDVWCMLAGGYAPPIADVAPEGTFGAAASGDAEARRVLVRELSRSDDADDGVRALMDLDAASAKRLVLEGFRGWYRDVFRRRAAQTAVLLERDAATKVRLSTEAPPEQLIERATNGLEFQAEGWIRRVVLVPQLAMRPWNVMSADGSDLIICYPIADESLDADRSSPPAQAVRFHRALGDDKRLRMLKLLASRGSATLQELADAVGLAKSSAHHHLVILRAAGLVKVTLEDNSRYRLVREALAPNARLLERFLGEEDAP
jgi:DNA-binding transcriptional ArsR family regulator